MPTQTTNITGVSFGITYDGPLTWTIAKGVWVQATTAGTNSNYANSTLINHGNLFGGASGVEFYEVSDPGHFAIRNEKTGVIYGGWEGVYVQGSTVSALVENKGEITSAGAGVSLRSLEQTVVNHGEISGGGYGLLLYLAIPGITKGPVVNNFGLIESGNTGVYMGNGGDFVATLTNRKGAEIRGDAYAIHSDAKLALKNDGKVTGRVDLGEYDDKIVNKGKIVGNVDLGGGDDVFQMKGKAKAGTIDTGKGNDKVVLAKSADTLLFSTALDAATNVDTIKKFQSGKDKFFLESSVFGALADGVLAKMAFRKGKEAKDADDHVIYDKKSGALYYDADGVGGAAQVQFAKLDKGAKLKASDFTVDQFYV